MKVCVVGLGYVGLPLANAFANAKLEVIGLDINEQRIAELKQGIDRTKEVSKLAKMHLTVNPADAREADFIIIAVPTPVHDDNEPDFSPVESAAKIIGPNMKRGAIVVLESTVYPGFTEEFLVPLLEKNSHMKCGRDFKMGYSPERINPGDGEHTIDKVIKVVSGQDADTLEKVASLYSSVCKAGVHRAPSIKTAEAAKVIENIQRDLNIALMNELSVIFEKIGINTGDVLAASRTKWNFGRYAPGMVGGHCIPVDPYYLVYKAQQLGYSPKVILAGREMNDSVPERIVEWVEDALTKVGKKVPSARLFVMGLTFKEDVPDIRTSPSLKLVRLFQKRGAHVLCFDPLLSDEVVKKASGFDNTPLEKIGEVDCIIMTVPHAEFKKKSLDELKGHMDKPVLIDVKGVFDLREAEKKGFVYRAL